MRLIVIAIFLSIAFSACNSESKHLFNYWKFDEPNGKLSKDEINNIADSIHYIFNTEKPLSDPIRRHGILGEALLFDGFSSYIERDQNKFATPNGSFSISVWVAPRAFEHGDGDKLSAIVNQQDLNEKAGFALGMFRHGKWSFQIGTDDQWVEIWDDGNPLPRRKWSFLTATYDLPNGRISLFMNGELIEQKELSSASPIKPANQPLVIGKHNQSEFIRSFPNDIPLNMFNGLMDELKIFNGALTSAEIKKSYQSYLSAYDGKIPEIPYDDIKIVRSKYKDAPYRPQFHAIPPGHWMNEPHAPFFYNGKYHLTYQHNPTGPYWHNIHWGHWVSDDLVHWKDLPEAIFPENDSIRPDGIWTGSAFVDENGIPILAYTFGNWSKKFNQGVAFSRPADPGDPDLVEWIEDSIPAITQKPEQGLAGEFRDPFIWFDKQQGIWYALVGSGIEGKGGTAWCYTSADMKAWELKGPFYQSNYKQYPFLGSIWELPVFLPIGKYDDGMERYIMIVSPKGLNQNVEVYYWLGKFDKLSCRFVPDDEEPMYWDYGENTYIGPSGMIDPRTGRALIFTIAAGGRGPGWAAGCVSLPQHIFLNKDGSLGVKPIEELQSLRDEELLSITDASVLDVNQELKHIQGEMLEIMIEFKSSETNKYGINVLKSPDGKEGSLIYYDPHNKKLGLETSKSSLGRRSFNRRPSTDTRAALRGHFDIGDENLKLHIFIDHALVEVFANDKNTITKWIYPSLSESNGVQIDAPENVIVKSVKIWSLKSIYY